MRNKDTSEEICNIWSLEFLVDVGLVIKSKKKFFFLFRFMELLGRLVKRSNGKSSIQLIETLCSVLIIFTINNCLYHFVLKWAFLE